MKIRLCFAGTKNSLSGQPHFFLLKCKIQFNGILIVVYSSYLEKYSITLKCSFDLMHHNL